MGAKGSVSPKERVNIVYKSDVGDAKREVELPLKVLVLGDFGFNGGIGGPLEDREILNINKDNFDDILEGHELVLDMDVADRISGNEDGNLSVSLGFKKMKDFEPESIIEQVPELQKIIELRKAIMSLKGPLGNIPAFRKSIQQILDDEGAREQLIKELGL